MTEENEITITQKPGLLQMGLLVLILVVALMALGGAAANNGRLDSINASVHSQSQYPSANQVYARFNATDAAIASQGSAQGTYFSSLQGQMVGLNRNLSSIKVSGNNAGVNANLSALLSQDGQYVTISELNSEQGNIISDINTWQSLHLSSGARLILNNSTVTVPANQFAVGILLPGAENLLHYWSNQTLTMDIMPGSQVRGLVDNSGFTPTETYTGSAETVWFNESGCGTYVYVLFGGGASFGLSQNVTANAVIGAC